jgi:hypothetical protein
VRAVIEDILALASVLCAFAGFALLMVGLGI